MYTTTRQRLSAALAFLGRIATTPLAVHPQVVYRLNDEHQAVVKGLTAMLDHVTVEEAVSSVNFETWLEGRDAGGRIRKERFGADERKAAQEAWLAGQEQLLARIARLEEERLSPQTAPMPALKAA